MDPHVDAHPNLLQTFNGQPYVDFLRWFNEGIYVNNTHFLTGSPKITWNLLPEAITQPTITPRVLILHTQAGSTKATNQSVRAYMDRPGVVVEPHIIGPEMFGGEMLQVMPFNIRADTSFKANRYQIAGSNNYYGAISMETQDNGGATVDTTPWTFDQILSISQTLTAVCATYGVWCTVPATWNDSGIAQHNLFPEWSVNAHSCPGAARTRQMDYIRSDVANRLAHYYNSVGLQCPS